MAVEMTDIVDRIADAISSIPAANPSYITLRPETLREVLSPGMIRKIAQVAAEAADTQQATEIEKWKTAYAMCDRSRDAFAAEIEQLRAEIDEWSHRAKTAETRLSKQNVEIERLRAERDDWRKRAFAGMPSAE